MKHIPRIYAEQELSQGSVIRIDSDTEHHLINVLRIADGETVRVFNSQYGEWEGTCNLRKRDVSITCDKRLREPKIEPGFTVIFALIAPPKMHMILEKATELGAAQFYPVITEYTQNKAFNVDKANTIIRNAVEQCGRMSLPCVHKPVKLRELLESWTESTRIIVGDLCDNRDVSVLNRSATFLIGPEGGFSEAERELFKRHDFILSLQISDNILRAETAAIAFSALCI